MRCMVMCLIALGLAGCGLKKTVAPGKSPALLTRVTVSLDGSAYKAQYSLQDNELRDTSSNGSLWIQFADEDSTVYFTDIFHVDKDDFKKYRTILDQEVWAHIVIIPTTRVKESRSGLSVTVHLEFVTTSGRRFAVDTPLRL